MLNVAIMICGHMRTYQKCYDNFISKIILPNKNHNLDVYIATSDINSGRVNLSPTIDPLNQVQYDKKYYKGHGLIYEVSKKNLEQKITDLYQNKNFNLKKILFQNENLSDNNIDPMSWEWFRRGIFSKPYFCLKNVDNIENYDIIVRTRPDLILKKEITFFKSESLKVFGGWPADEKYESRKYLADFFAYGSPNTMKTYCNIHLMKKPMDTTVTKHPYNSENQLNLYLNSKNIKTEYIIQKRNEYEIQR